MIEYLVRYLSGGGGPLGMDIYEETIKADSADMANKIFAAKRNNKIVGTFVKAELLEKRRNSDRPWWF